MRFRPVFFMGPGGRKVEAGRWPARARIFDYITMMWRINLYIMACAQESMDY